MPMVVAVLLIYLTEQKQKDANHASKYNKGYIEDCLSFKYKEEKMITRSN